MSSDSEHARPQMDFSEIIPKMREAIGEYMAKKSEQGKPLSERDATIKWLDRYYDEWLASQVETGQPSQVVAGNAADKRRARRIPIEIAAYYRVLWTPSDAEGRGEPTPAPATAEPAEVRNISAGGLFIVTGKPYPVSTLMEIQFELPGLSESISAFSMVVWRSDNGAGKFGHGLHFSHIETRDTDLINEAIMERLLDAPVVMVK